MLVFSEFGEVTPLPALIPCHSREEEEAHCQLQTGFRPETAEPSKVTKGQLRGREHCFPEQGPQASVLGSTVTDSDSSSRRDLGIGFNTHSLEISV